MEMIARNPSLVRQWGERSRERALTLRRKPVQKSGHRYLKNFKRKRNELPTPVDIPPMYVGSGAFVIGSARPPFARSRSRYMLGRICIKHVPSLHHVGDEMIMWPRKMALAADLCESRVSWVMHDSRRRGLGRPSPCEARTAAWPTKCEMLSEMLTGGCD